MSGECFSRGGLPMEARYGEGLILGFTCLEYEDGEVRPLYVTQYPGYNVDLFVSEDALFNSESVWMVMVEGEFDEYFEEV